MLLECNYVGVGRHSSFCFILRSLDRTQSTQSIYGAIDASICGCNEKAFNSESLVYTSHIFGAGFRQYRLIRVISEWHVLLK